jgi:hypothetical protein
MMHDVNVTLNPEFLFTSSLNQEEVCSYHQFELKSKESTSKVLHLEDSCTVLEHGHFWK